MADGRKNNRPVNGLKPGQSGNPKGASNKVRVIKSKLRELADELRPAQPDAVANINASAKGTQVPKERLESSKWLVSTLISLEKAILSEEIARTKLKIELLDVNSPDEQTPQEIEKELKPRLSLVYKDPNSEDEDGE